MPTIYDVARAAGVSPSTVSRAFSRPGRVSAETAERVRAVAAELGYRTRPVIRPAIGERTSMIALVIADSTNPFHFEIIRGAQAAAAEAGYTLLLADAQESDRLERQALERTLPAVDGIVLASSRMSDSAIRMIAKRRPLVVLNRAVADVPSVVTDVSRGMRRAVEHLADLGHRVVTYVAGPEASWTDGMRWRSLRSAAVSRGLRTRRIGPYPPTIDGGRASVAALSRVAATAVVAYNDMMAMGLLHGSAAAGIRVPTDLSVIGCDDIFAAELVTPPLTTVAAPLRTLGGTAVHNVLAIAHGATSTTGEPVVLPTRLVIRGSTSGVTGDGRGPLQRRGRRKPPVREPRGGPGS